MAPAGLSRANRAFVAQLNRVLPGPFTPEQAAKAAGLDHPRAARLLRHLAEQGWVARVQRGLYTTVPLEAEDPQHWSVDPWAVAAAALAPRPSLVMVLGMIVTVSFPLNHGVGCQHVVGAAVAEAL